MLMNVMDAPSHLAWLCVLAIFWLCSVHRQQSFGSQAYKSNGGLNPNDVAVKSNQVVTWKGPDGRPERIQMEAVAAEGASSCPNCQKTAHLSNEAAN